MEMEELQKADKGREKTCQEERRRRKGRTKRR